MPSPAGPLALLEGVLYYYDQMFTLCYTLHLLFTRQYVHDLKLHVTEREKCSLAGQSDHWLTESPARTLCQRNRKGPPRYLLMRLSSRRAPTPILYHRCHQPIRFESSCISRFQPEVEPEDYLCFLRDIAFKLYVVRFDDSSRGKTKIYDRRLLKPSKISIKPTQPFSVSSRQIPPNLHSSSRLKVRPNLRTPLRM